MLLGGVGTFIYLQAEFINIGGRLAQHRATATNGDRAFKQLGVILQYFNPAFIVKITPANVCLIIRMGFIHKFFRMFS